MPANLENSQWPQDWTRSVFIPVPKKGNAKECSNYCTIALISHASWRRQWHPTPVLLPGKSHGGGAWWAAVHGVVKSQTRLRDFSFTFRFHALEKEMATHSNVLAWRVPGTEEPSGPPSMGSHRVGHDWSDLAAAAAYSTGNSTRYSVISYMGKESEKEWIRVDIYNWITVLYTWN